MTDSQSSLAIRILNANPHAYESLVIEAPTPKLAHELLDSVALPPPMMAALWLWHDGLSESHAISQQLHNSTGSFWHAIMHRREGDFSNSKYWYARAAGHPALGELSKRGFDPEDFVDLVREIHNRPDHKPLAEAIELQKLEWRTLFNHCEAE